VADEVAVLLHEQGIQHALVDDDRREQFHT
jgi:hypothetical protein